MKKILFIIILLTLFGCSQNKVNITSFSVVNNKDVYLIDELVKFKIEIDSNDAEVKKLVINNINVNFEQVFNYIQCEFNLTSTAYNIKLTYIQNQKEKTTSKKFDLDLVIKQYKTIFKATNNEFEDFYFYVDPSENINLPKIPIEIEGYTSVGWVYKGTIYEQHETIEIKEDNITFVALYERNYSYNSDFIFKLENDTYTITGLKTESEVIYIANMYLGKRITKISDDAFNGCNFKLAFISSSIEYIGQNAFSNNSNLNSVIINENSKLSYISNNAFSNTGLAEINIPPTVNYIGANAFKNTKIIENANTNGFVYLNNWLISYKGVLPSEATISFGITHIAPYALASCSSIKTLTLSSSVTVIYEYAFYNTSQLGLIVLNDNLNYLGDFAFSNCYNLTQIEINKNSNLTYIGKNAFKDCLNLTSFQIPNKVIEIDDYAFLGCLALKELAVPSNVIRLGKSLFLNCTNITFIIEDFKETFDKQFNYLGNNLYAPY